MYEYSAKVLKVIDGDTVQLDVDCGFNCHFIEKFRIARINAPEMSTPEGVVARDFALTLMPIGSTVTISSSKRDTPIREEKYGRWLAEITLADGFKNFSALMLDSGHAVLWK